MAAMTSDEYRDERRAAVVCGSDDIGHPNCRHAWNEAHPDDPVTTDEQDEWERTIVAKLRRS